MTDVRRLFVIVCALLMGRAGGIEPSSGYCIEKQCFAVFKDPGNFETVQNQCTDLGGHLMTVRSTVSHDILSILLANTTGRFWVGLFLMSPCPDPSAKLKGFQWVTGDSESDFYDWAPTFDSSCSSHRCVSISQEEDFKWVQTPCSEQAAGFLCEYSFRESCKSLEVAEGESVTYRTTMGFEGEDIMYLPIGSTAIRMPAKTKHICSNEQWLQGPWSCEIQEGGCEYKCAVDPTQMPSCYCPVGQDVNPANNITCEFDQRDPCVSLRCAHECYKDGDSSVCICEHGFQLAPDGRSCVDFNECADERQCPAKNSMCINTHGGFQCICKGGFKMMGGTCADIDECASAPCEHDCNNTPGSYTCSCYDGYKQDPASPDKCKLHCGEEECQAECDPNDRWQCNCPDGYISEEREDHTVCVDIDECFHQFCDQDCENTYGSYVCTCSPGYMLVEQYKCVKTGTEADTDGGSEGSGATTTFSIFTASPVPHPDPTRQPSRVTIGGLVGIIVCTAFFIVLLVFLAHHVLCGRGKMESASAVKAPENEAHSLHHVTSDS